MSEQKNEVPPLSKNEATFYHYRIHQVPVFQQNPNATEIHQALSHFLRISLKQIFDLKIIRQSLDARRGRRSSWKFSLDFSSSLLIKNSKLQLFQVEAKTHCNEKKSWIHQSRIPKRIAVVGYGPAGMAVALDLSKKGYQVHVFEQGSPVEERFRHIRQFIKSGLLNPYSNVIFGEGGAGTFSDGKLTCRSKTEYTQSFLEALVTHGAPESSVYLQRPHVGTDKLQFVLKSWRQQCIKQGVQFHFSTQVREFLIEKNKVNAIRLSDGWTHFGAVALCCGHSSRQIYQRLFEQGVPLESKAFALGVRVEHPQSLIGIKNKQSQEYTLVAPSSNSNPGAYSFCMCPGGVLVPCADEDGAIFTNGMSYSARNSAFGNAAVVVPVGPEDFGKKPLDGLNFQRQLEQKAFQMAGSDLAFPAQTIKAFMENRSDLELPPSSLLRPLTPINFRELFPDPIVRTLENSFHDFNRKIPNFINTGLMTGPETRTSSAVRIIRDALSLESVGIRGLFPLGSGSGYAGGIVSSGGDGFKFTDLFAPVSGL